MEQHTIDIDEREHQQEECVEVTNHIRFPMKPSEPDKKEKKLMEEWTTKINNVGLGLLELPPPQTSSNQPPPPTEEEEDTPTEEAEEKDTPIEEEEEEEEEEEPCIFRVHQGLRHVNEKAYTPVLVSIGPYHHGQPQLVPMEKHKERYLELLLQRNNQREEDYLDSMTRLEERTRKCYANPVDHLDSTEFVKMMLNDACFVTEFLHSMYICVGDDPIVKIGWMRMQICSDLMQLENQLPFFVLSEFYGMSHGRTPALKELVEYPIIRMLPRDQNLFNYHFKKRHFRESKHFLDVVHKVCRPTNPDQYKHSTGSDRKPCLKMPCVIELEEAGVTFECKEVSPTINAEHSTESNWGTCLKMPCVIEHEEAGVTFEEESTKEVSMFDIDFENGHFKIPKFEVVDWTETFFRNIIAYEQHSSDDEPKYFSDYTYFMDLLINSKEDVSQLRRHEIVDHMLGDDEEVAVMFNKLGNGRLISLDKFYYNELCRKVNAHCEKWWNRRVAALKRDYFKNIWVTVATIAAAFLLLLTLIQTVIALTNIHSSSLSPR